MKNEATKTNPYEKFMISQVGLWFREGKALILEDARYPGQWVLPGGRIDEGEDPEVGFHRELKEELGLDGFKVGPVVDVDVWYTPNDNKPYCAVVRMIYSDAKDQDIVLSHEHHQYKWITEEELDELPILWPNGKRMYKSGFTYNKAHGDAQ